MIPNPNPYPPQTEFEYMVNASSFQWAGTRQALARRWKISETELVRILRGQYGPGSWNG